MYDPCSLMSKRFGKNLLCVLYRGLESYQYLKSCFQITTEFNSLFVIRSNQKPSPETKEWCALCIANVCIYKDFFAWKIIMFANTVISNDSWLISILWYDLGLLWAKIAYLKSNVMLFSCNIQRDMALGFEKSCYTLS